MGFKKEKLATTQTVVLTVLVQFMDGTLGDFQGTFNRVPQSRLDELLDPDAAFSNTEVLDEVLAGVSGITGEGVELPAAEQLALVKQTPECVGAAVAAFFKAMRPARYDDRTSKKRR